MPNIIPLFHSSSSGKQGGIFTFEEAGAAAKAGHVKGPVSLCDLAKAEGLKQLHLAASKFTDFMVAQKNLKKVGCDLVFGLKLVVCDDMAAKNDASLKTESRVVIFIRDDAGGHGVGGYDVLKNIYTKAATDGFYYVPRIDWKTLKYLWSDRLILCLPFYSSFLAKNALTFAAMAPELPCVPVLLRERGQGMPFDDVLEGAVARYAKATGAVVEDVKSIYYKTRKDAKSYLVWRCSLNRSTYDKPNLDHFGSKEFCYESFKELAA